MWDHKALSYTWQLLQDHVWRLLTVALAHATCLWARGPAYACCSPWSSWWSQWPSEGRPWPPSSWTASGWQSSGEDCWSTTSIHIGKVNFFVTFSCDNLRTSTPKTIYILNQHDKGNVLGPPFHWGLGLGSGAEKVLPTSQLRKFWLQKSKHNQLFGGIFECKLPHPTASEGPRKQPNLTVQSAWLGQSTWPSKAGQAWWRAYIFQFAEV